VVLDDAGGGLPGAGEIVLVEGGGHNAVVCQEVAGMGVPAGLLTVFVVAVALGEGRIGECEGENTQCDAVPSLRDGRKHAA